MRRCRLLAQLGRARMSAIWLLSGAKRTSARDGRTIVFYEAPSACRLLLQHRALALLIVELERGQPVILP